MPISRRLINLDRSTTAAAREKKSREGNIFPPTGITKFDAVQTSPKERKKKMFVARKLKFLPSRREPE